MNPSRPPQPLAQRIAKSPQSRIDCGSTTAVRLDRIGKTGPGQKRCSKTHWSRSAKVRREVHRSPAAILAPSPKCWSRSDGGYMDIGRYGRANVAAPAGSGMRPLQALEFRIEQPERPPGVTAVEQNSYRSAARDSQSQTSAPRGKFCRMDGRNCTSKCELPTLPVCVHTASISVPNLLHGKPDG